MNLCSLTAHEALALLDSGEITSLELTQAVLDRISRLDNHLQAFITVTRDRALSDARDADKSRATGENTTQGKKALLGIPVAVKDLICTEGIRTTCASRILESFIPPYDATVVDDLKRAGAVLIGKTNMDEFAMGSSTENSGFFPTKNPWDLSRVPGGTSGGSAAAIAADETILALGSDTGGSIRQPAAFCGVVGMKPSYGRVSRYGLVAFASSFDQIGPITKDVHDAALLMSVIARYDPRDSTSIPFKIEPVPDYLDALVPDIEGFRIGVPKEYFLKGMQEGVEVAVRNALCKMQDEMGARLVDVSLPHTEYCIPTYYIIAAAEASTNLARYDGVKYGYRYPSGASLLEMYERSRAHGFGAEVKRRIMLGTYALSAGYKKQFYVKASQVRTLIKRDFERAFEKCDVIIAPVAPTVAFGIGEKIGDPLQMYLGDIFTLSLNLAGFCGIAIPCGSADGLPVGLQIMGDRMAELTILRVAYAYEQATEWHKCKPDLQRLSFPPVTRLC